jgi:hypothetical protein
VDVSCPADYIDTEFLTRWLAVRLVIDQQRRAQRTRQGECYRDPGNRLKAGYERLFNGLTPS